MGTSMAATRHWVFSCLYAEKHMDSETILRPGGRATINSWHYHVAGVGMGVR